MSSDPHTTGKCTVILPDGNKEFHEVGVYTDGGIGHRVQVPGREMTPWNRSAMPQVPGGCLVFDVVPDYGTGTSLQVFAIGNDHQLYHSVRHSESGDWTGMNVPSKWISRFPKGLQFVSVDKQGETRDSYSTYTTVAVRGDDQIAYKTTRNLKDGSWSEFEPKVPPPG